MEKVLTLLSNLVVQIDRDASNDEADHSEFTFWFEAQERSTDEAIGGLNAKLGELSASLTDLRAHRQTTAAKAEDIRGQKTIQDEQLTQATSKRGDEKDAFVKEQLDFKNSIEACERAVELLTAHYGDGSPRENTKPAWLSLAGILSTIRSAAKRHGKPVSVALSQQAPDYFNAGGSSLYNTYEDSTGEALSVVDQVKQLKKTFEEDKASAAEQEQSLSAAFTQLSHEKENIISTLISQLTELSATVTAAEEQIAEEAAAEQTAQVSLQNEQAYMTQIRAQAKDVNDAYASRKKDRAAEREALREAQSILSAPRDTALLQAQLCPQCARATALLRKAAQSLHSEVLSTAAAEASAPGALADVVTELEGLLRRIDETQAAEAQHAEWCTKELSGATAKKEQHTALGVEAETSLQNAEVLLTEKQQALDEVKEDVADLDADWQQQEQLRASQKGDLALAQQNSLAAVAALEQAEQMLAAFYGAPAPAEDPPAMIQRPARLAQEPQRGNTDSYARVGGRVLAALAELRRDFAAAADDAAKAEETAERDFGAAKSHYEETRGNLVDSGTQLVQQLQTADKDRQTLRESLAAHQSSVDSAVSYLEQLRKSCSSLTANFATREQVRKEERAAVAEAIAVLKGEAPPPTQ
jgi:hypothetical protein